MLPSKKQLKNLVSKNPGRYSINNILVENDKIIATDGKILGIYEAPKNSISSDREKNILTLDSFDFHNKSLNDKENNPSIFIKDEIVRTHETIKKNKNSGLSESVFENIEVTEEKFPDYVRCIPTKKASYSICLDIDLLKKICDSSIASENGFNRALFEFHDEGEAVLISPESDKIKHGFLLMPVCRDEAPKSFFKKDL